MSGEAAGFRETACTPPRTVVVYDDDLVLHSGHLHAAVGVADPLVCLHVKHL